MLKIRGDFLQFFGMTWFCKFFYKKIDFNIPVKKTQLTAPKILVWAITLLKKSQHKILEFQPINLH